MKFNSFFLIAFKKRFPNYLRDELEAHYDAEMDALFDMSEVRRELQTRLASLIVEREQNEKLQQRFERIEKQLRHHHSPTMVAAGDDGNVSEDNEDSDDNEQVVDLDNNYAAQRSSDINKNNKNKKSSSKK